MSTLKARILPVFIVALAAHGTYACGSDSEGDEGNGGNGTAGTGPVLNVGGSTSGGGLTGPHDGGTVDLTPEQIADINNAACTGWRAEGENLPAVLQLVVDVSGSMEDDAPGGGNQSKWDVTRDALSDAIDTLPASTSAGVLYYPNQDVESDDSPRDVTACVNTDELVPIAALGAPGSMHRDVLQTSLDDANTEAFTPTHDAYKYALETSLKPFQTQANKFMLLITDGAPTMALECVGGNLGGGMGMGGGGITEAPTAPIVAEVAAAAAAGIRTFVIGSPGSEESAGQDGEDMRPWLSEAAQVGGTAQPGCSNTGPNFCHLDMTQAEDFSEALVAGLAAIAGQIIDSCTFTIPDPGPGKTVDPNLTTLIIQTSAGGKLVLPDNMGDCTEGWQFTAANEVVLCPASCDQVKNDSSATVQLTFGCTTDQVVPVE